MDAISSYSSPAQQVSSPFLRTRRAKTRGGRKLVGRDMEHNRHELQNFRGENSTRARRRRRRIENVIKDNEASFPRWVLVRKSASKGIRNASSLQMCRPANISTSYRFHRNPLSLAEKKNQAILTWNTKQLEERERERG